MEEDFKVELRNVEDERERKRRKIEAKCREDIRDAPAEFDMQDLEENDKD